MVGFEPTEKRSGTTNSVANIDSRGSNEGSTFTSPSSTDLLDAIKFIQSLPLTLDEKADAVRKLVKQTP
jgi:hypothetical protein